MVISAIALVLVLLSAALLGGAAMVYSSARALIHPPRMTDGKAAYLLRRLSPGDLGLRYEETTFAVRDERSGASLRIAGWWIPAEPGADRCVVLIHGYADAKVGVIAWAPLWHELGFHVLAIDLRAHGESDGAICTGGEQEWRDVSQVIDQLRHERPTQTERVALFGVSFGAAVAAAVAAERDDLALLVLDSPFADFRTAAQFHLGRLGLPRGLPARLSVSLAERFAEEDFSQQRPVDRITQVQCPMWVITPENDPHLPPADARAVADALASRSHSAGDAPLWRPHAAHLLALAAEPGEYRRRLAQFVDAVGLLRNIGR